LPESLIDGETTTLHVVTQYAGEALLSTNFVGNTMLSKPYSYDSNNLASKTLCR